MLSLRLGAHSSTIKGQLAEQGFALSRGALRRYERWGAQIMDLSLWGFITPYERRLAEQRLVKSIAKDVRPLR